MSERGTSSVNNANIADQPMEIITLHPVGTEAPWRWLKKGWSDMWSVPMISLSYGAGFALLSAVIVAGLLGFGMQSLVIALWGLFLLLGPMLAVGLYEASRRLENGEPITFGDVTTVGVRSRGQLAFMGVMLMLLSMLWVLIAFILFMVFFGVGPLPPVTEFISHLLMTQHGVTFLLIGSLTGITLALAVYALSVISIPMLMVRKVDVVTAAMTSMRAVRENPSAMLLWAILIVALTAAGVAAAFVGLIITFPLVGHATWHAYREIVEGAK